MSVAVTHLDLAELVADVVGGTRDEADVEERRGELVNAHQTALHQLIA